MLWMGAGFLFPWNFDIILLIYEMKYFNNNNNNNNMSGRDQAQGSSKHIPGLSKTFAVITQL